jgi:hypothetical protein
MPGRLEREAPLLLRAARVRVFDRQTWDWGTRECFLCRSTLDLGTIGGAISMGSGEICFKLNAVKAV